VCEGWGVHRLPAPPWTTTACHRRDDRGPTPPTRAAGAARGLRLPGRRRGGGTRRALEVLSSRTDGALQRGPLGECAECTFGGAAEAEAVKAAAVKAEAVKAEAVKAEAVKAPPGQLARRPSPYGEYLPVISL